MTKPSKSAALFQALLLWFCVACTLLMAGSGIWFYLHFLKYEEGIKGNVVLLKGVAPPDDGQPPEKVRAWIDGFSDALPNCRCFLGKSSEPASDSALLVCFGFSFGSDACVVKTNEFPSGVSAKASPMANIDTYTKAVLLLDELLPWDAMSPRAGRKKSYD